MIAQRVLGRLLEAGFEVVICLPGGEAFATEARRRGVRTEAVGAELATLLLESLASYRPEPEPVAVRLVTRGNRRRIFAAWWRLALGGVEYESVDLVEHTDFWGFGSEATLFGVIEGHLAASEITSPSG